ncbi:uncharacterized protein BDZ99DRAFT_423932 [Mytilinidion resinicola]|uniref:CorA-like transporter domain-containing protein n=1 Tax=Mytilinidion resinicola TaxID=574789 RepID=A0A6A6Y9U8_9PEZI|nr:uncharacterized protein BDZ99DRAFT_423932 [Mytilinidion resinicola]KAF2805602.1 hypothetical protein BDZ99DRAFT_423932 [Mytilinidion resinicola]
MRQNYSWGRLRISEEIGRKLFTSLMVHPSFLAVVHLFGEKTEPVEESLSVYFCHPLSQYRPKSQEIPPFMNGGYVVGYNLKYAARHGRSFLEDPFSVRDAGLFQFYAKGSHTVERCNWIFINLPETLEQRLAEVLKDAEGIECDLQFQINAMVLLDATKDWKIYVNFLEEFFRRLLEVGFYTKVDGPTNSGDINADFSDIRKLQLFTDKLRGLHQSIRLNLDLGAGLQQSMNDMGKTSDMTSSARSSALESFNSQMNMFIWQHRTHLGRIESLIARAQGVSSLIQSILDIRTADSSTRINSAVHDITEQGMEENKLIKRLTHQSTQDTRAMKVIAFISAIFLPSTFVAVGLQWWYFRRQR